MNALSACVADLSALRQVLTTFCWGDQLLQALFNAKACQHAVSIPSAYHLMFPVQRSALKLHAEHRVLRCRLDFLTDRQLHKLRMLAGLKLAAVSQLQHCAIAMVPYLDAQRHLRIIGVLLNSSR